MRRGHMIRHMPRAAVLYEAGQPLRVEEVELASPQSREVRVRVLAAGVCHSDYHYMKGDLSTQLPAVLGHEGAGVVEEVGADVTTVAAGDHVVLLWRSGCGHCPYCAIGRPALCQQGAILRSTGRLLDGTSRLSRGGRQINHFLGVSCFSEATVCPEQSVLKIDDDVPMEIAALAGCSVMTGVGAATNSARVEPGSSVLVIGAGGVGLCAIMGAGLCGAARIVAADLNPAKLEMARDFGASDVIDVSHPGPRQDCARAHRRWGGLRLRSNRAAGNRDRRGAVPAGRRRCGRDRGGTALGASGDQSLRPRAAGEDAQGFDLRFDASPCGLSAALRAVQARPAAAGPPPLAPLPAGGGQRGVRRDAGRQCRSLSHHLRQLTGKSARTLVVAYVAVTGTPAPDAEALATAREARPRWVSDQGPGIRRRRRGESFAYLQPDGSSVEDEETLDRIQRLVIPPAWTDVWISPLANGHIQATGRDARGRKQYRYHERWRSVRDSNKYGRLIEFAGVLPKIRSRVRRDLRRPGHPREKVLATVVQLLEATMMRVGNEEYAKENRSYGLTTLRNRHVKVRGSKVRFFFRGKCGKEHEITVRDRRLAAVVRRCEELPGQQLFQYLDEDGRRRGIDSSDVNDYLREAGGGDFTAKDFRTWAGTVLAARALQEMKKVDSEAQAKRNVVEAIEKVAERLGNTRSVCRKCYVHPAIVDSYMDGSMLEVLQSRAEHEMRTSLRRLNSEEAAVLALLQVRFKREARSRRSAA